MNAFYRKHSLIEGGICGKKYFSQLKNKIGNSKFLNINNLNSSLFSYFPINY